MKKYKYNILVFFIFCGFSLCYAQQKVTWDDLAEVTFTEEYSPAYEYYFLKPHFKESVKQLDGKKIAVTGYFLNIFPEENVYVLSKNPMSACFFCGVGGPETAIELHFLSKPTFKTDAIVTVTGILKINGDDVEHFNYILQSHRAVKVN